jgi:hypothetical protein
MEPKIKLLIIIINLLIRILIKECFFNEIYLKFTKKFLILFPSLFLN